VWLLTCPDCAAEVSDAASACPACGKPMGRGGPVHTLLRIVGLLFGIPSLIFLALVLYWRMTELLLYGFVAVLLSAAVFYIGESRARAARRR